MDIVDWNNLTYGCCIETYGCHLSKEYLNEGFTFSKFYPPVHGGIEQVAFDITKELQKVMVSLLTFSVLILLGKKRRRKVSL